VSDRGAVRRVGVAVNPTAAGGRARDAGLLVVGRLRAAGHDVVDLTGTDATDATARTTTAVRDGAVDALVVVGGDGMVHVGVQAVAGAGVPLGVVAAGTGNDFAAAHDLPVRRPGAAADLLLTALATGRTRPVDAIAVTGAPGSRWVAGAVSAGLDAAVNGRANALPARLPARYVLSALAEIATFRAWGYDLTFTGVVDDGGLPLEPAASADDVVHRWRGRAALVTAANIHRIGGGIRVAPDARSDDGLLDVVVATVLTRAAAATIFPSMFSGRHTRRRDVHVVRAGAVTIAPADVPSADRPRGARQPSELPLAHGDGEALGPLPVTARAVPGAVALLAAPGGP
jgi:diacylglycerol kinase (ATP)